MVELAVPDSGLRHNLQVSQLPPLLQGKLSPEVDSTGTNLAALITFIHGVAVKPPLGPAPAATASADTGYSTAASAIAGILARTSKDGHFADPQTTMEALAGETQLTVEDVRDALHEIRHYVDVSWDRVWPKDIFFPEFDKYFMGWDPAADALRLAADIVNDLAFTDSPAKIAETYAWPARRLNSRAFVPEFTRSCERGRCNRQRSVYLLSRSRHGRHTSRVCQKPVLISDRFERFRSPWLRLRS